MWEYNYTDTLAHHGIKGQKWGVRRFQNEDGSLTPEGELRYERMYGDYNAESKARLIKAESDRENMTKSERREAAKRGKKLRERAAEIERQSNDVYRKAYDEYWKQNRAKAKDLEDLDDASSEAARKKSKQWTLDRINEMGDTAYNDLTIYFEEQIKLGERSTKAFMGVLVGLSVAALIGKAYQSS